MKFWIATSALIMMAGFATTAHAKGDGPCKKDMETLCAGVEPGEGRLKQCMMDNADKLSPACKAHKDKMQEAIKDIKESCEDDVDKYCADEKPGHGNIMKCLKKHKDEVSQACKDEIEKMKKAHKKRK